MLSGDGRLALLPEESPVNPRNAPMALILGALLLLAGDVLQLLRVPFAWTVLLALAFVLLAAGLLVVPQTLGALDRPTIVAGSLTAFVGAVAGAAMQGLFRAWAVLESAGHSAAVTLLQGHAGIRWTTLFPGLLFPLGLLLLALGLHLSRRLPAVAALTLAVGALLFPVGHAVGLPLALAGGDLVLIAAFVAVYLGTRAAPATGSVSPTA